MKEMNCVWLNKQNPFDVLCKIQDALLSGNRFCILKAITSGPRICPHYEGAKTDEETCHKCIESWMIEQHP